MDVHAFPQSGYLNTTFGFTATGSTGDRFRFAFGRGGWATGWVDADTSVYFRFAEPGVHVVRAQNDRNMGTAETEVTVRQARRLGGGKVEGAVFFPGGDRFVVRLSTGIEIYDRRTLGALSLDVEADWLIPSGPDEAVLFRADGSLASRGTRGRLGVLDLRTGRIRDDEVVLMLYASATEGRVLYESGPGGARRVTHRDLRRGRSFVAAGQAKTWSPDGRHVFVTLDGELSLAGPDGTTPLGQFDAARFLPGGEAALLRGGGRERLVTVPGGRVWDLDHLTRGGVPFAGGHLLRVPGYGPCFRTSREPSSVTLLRRLTRPFAEAEAIGYPDGLLIIVGALRGRFPEAEGGEHRTLLEGTYVATTDGETSTVTSTRTGRAVLSTTGTVVGAAAPSGRPLVAVESKPETALYDLRTGRELARHDGRLHGQWAALLERHGHLWVSDGYYSSAYRVVEVTGGETVSELAHVLEVDDRLGVALLRAGVARLSDPSATASLGGKPLAVSDRGEALIVGDGRLAYVPDIWGAPGERSALRDVDLAYDHAGVSPDGSLFAAGRDGKTEVFDLRTMEVVSVIDTNYVRFNPDGTLLGAGWVQRKHDYLRWAKPRVFDPATGKPVTGADLTTMEFVSPSGALSAALGKDGRVEVYVRGSREPKWSVSVEDYTFVNFIALSDKTTGGNRVAIAGKPPGGGRVRTAVLSGWVQSVVDLPGGKAVWKCLFSPDGEHVSYYTSTPVTHVYRVADLSAGVPPQPRNTFQGRSLESFSPNGRCLALSDRGYHAISVGGTGWQTSKSLWICEVDGAQVAVFDDHAGDVTSAEFSRGGTHLVSRDTSGVVIVRPLDEATRKAVASQ